MRGWRGAVGLEEDVEKREACWCSYERPGIVPPDSARPGKPRFGCAAVVHRTYAELGLHHHSAISGDPFCNREQFYECYAGSMAVEWGDQWKRGLGAR